MREKTTAQSLAQPTTTMGTREEEGQNPTDSISNHNIRLALAPALDQDQATNNQGSFNYNNANAEPPQQHQPSQEEEQQEEVFAVDNAFRVLTPEEQRRQRLEQQRQNAPLVEGRSIPDKKRQVNKKMNWMAIIPALLIVVIIVVVPSVVLTRQKQRNNAALTLTASPSVSLVPSWSPSVSVLPSSFPTTDSPTSTMFANVVSLLGLDQDSVPLDPNDHVFRSIQWMAEQDEITFALLQERADLIMVDENNETSGIQSQEEEEAVLLQEKALQRFAMVSLFYATKGEFWFDDLGFLNASSHECNWQVFGRPQLNPSNTTVHCVNNSVIGIALNNNNLGGMIPKEIGLLSRLLVLELQSNEIGGTFPSSFAQIPDLYALILDRNKISGSIPSELTTLSNFGEFFLEVNDLTGTIPESIGNLTKLIVFDVVNNFLTGSIPSSIENMTMLQFLHFQFNMLTSTLPTEMNNLQQLGSYLVNENMLTGTLPFEAGSNPSLTAFGCGGNDLSGEISSLVHLSGLGRLVFNNNKFTGTIPRELCIFPLQFWNGAIRIDS